MASCPGTSGGSNGGGKRPPSKRMKMDSDSNPESTQDPLHSNLPGCVSSAMRMQTEHLKCPVCQDYPRKECYQCSNGHIICHECLAKITRCPICRKDYIGLKIRNRVAEVELDEITYNCSYRSYGCLRTNIPRNQRTSHESLCSFNPSTPSFKFCNPFYSTCQFEICPNAMQDPVYCDNVIKHLEGNPHNMDLVRKLEIGKKEEFLLSFPNKRSSGPFVFFEVCKGTTGEIVGYYALIRRVEGPQHSLCWTMVGLNAVPEDPNGVRMTVKFTLKAKADPNKMAKDGKLCVPNQHWTVNSISLKDWNDSMGNGQVVPAASFGLPLKFLKEYYQQQDGMLELCVSFAPVGN